MIRFAHDKSHMLPIYSHQIQSTYVIEMGEDLVQSNDIRILLVFRSNKTEALM